MAEQNLVFNIYKEDGTSFNDIAIKSSTYTETVMSLDNNIEGDFYYPNNNLVFTYKEYITYKNVKYYLKIDEPQTIVRKGLIDDEYRDWETDRKSTRLNSSHSAKSRMPSSA